MVGIYGSLSKKSVGHHLDYTLQFCSVFARKDISRMEADQVNVTETDHVSNTDKSH